VTPRKITIAHLDLHVPAQALRGVSGATTDLVALGREVARRLGERLGAPAGDGSDAMPTGARRVEAHVPAGPLNAARIADAVEPVVRRAPASARKAAR
jgi:hypothetical protein